MNRRIEREVNMKKFWKNVYGDEDQNNSDDLNKGKDPPKPSENTPKTFTQAEVDRFLAEDRRKSKAQTEKLIQELEQLKKNKGLSEQERTNLATRIEELQNQILTKEQLLEKERTKLQSEHRTELQREKEEKESWRSRYTDSTIERTIMDVAIKAGAYAPEQIVALLQGTTKLVEDVDQEGNLLGTFTPRVKFRDIDAEGKSVTLDLTITEAVNRMKDLPERYGNLFKANVVGGLGGNGSVPTGTLDPNKAKSMSDYQRMREKIVGRPFKKGRA